ncbi:HAD hydrolase-like protein [Candidatus Woesearchaeota archaeon]|nr:HAD hydrolase-like protein [Candidatus Woesearchaeota archaeon]
MAKAKIYDYNGPIMDIAPFFDFLKAKDPKLYFDYCILGKKDRSKKDQYRPAVVELYEEAIQKGLFPAKLIPGIEERLNKDLAEGYKPLIFTTVPHDTMASQTKETGISKIFPNDSIITLTDIIKYGGLKEGIGKENPEVYQQLIKYLSGFESLETYVDDSEQRLSAAHEANISFKDTGKGIKRLYLFNPEAEKSPMKKEFYTLVNNPMHVE